MANHKSAWKRIRQNAKRRARNSHYKTFMRNRVKAVRKAIDAGDLETARAALTGAISALDGVASKGIIHRNKAARTISRLSKAVHKLATDIGHAASSS